MVTASTTRGSKISDHVFQLERELKKTPTDEVLRQHIKRLRKEWKPRRRKVAAA